MRLFNDGIRTYQGYRKPQESIYAFLNRSAQQEYAATRDILESWFQDYPSAYQLDLYKRIRSKLDRDHLGAFFELYCDALLRHQEFVSKPQQVVDETKGNPIDFKVQSTDTPLFYLEATVAMDVETTPVSQSILMELWQKFDLFQEPNFWIEIKVEQESTRKLPINDICSDIHKWLQGLNPIEVSSVRTTLTDGNWPRYELNGWKIVFIAIPKPAANRGKPGKTVLALSSPAQWRKQQNALQAALKDKQDKYGIFDLPYVIAVNVLAKDSVNCDVNEVFFGQEVALMDKQTGEITMTRSPLLSDRPFRENGFWLARSGPRNRQVSAVLIVNELLPWSIVSKTPTLWHNPCAEKPLNLALWQGPQMMIDMDEPEPQWQLIAGKKAQEIFHLHSESK